MKTVDNYSVDIFDRRGNGLITSINLTVPQYKLLMWLEENNLLGDTKLIVFHSVDKCYEEDENTEELDPTKADIIDFDLRTSKGIKHLVSCKVTSSQLTLIETLDRYKIWSSKYLITPRHFDNYTDLT